MGRSADLSPGPVPTGCSHHQMKGGSSLTNDSVQIPLDITMVVGQWIARFNQTSGN